MFSVKGFEADLRHSLRGGVGQRKQRDMSDLDAPRARASGHQTEKLVWQFK